MVGITSPPISTNVSSQATKTPPTNPNFPTTETRYPNIPDAPNRSRKSGRPGAPVAQRRCAVQRSSIRPYFQIAAESAHAPTKSRTMP